MLNILLRFTAATLGLLLLMLAANAEIVERGIGRNANSPPDKRVALIIGNGAYRNAARLPNPRNDAEDVAAALSRSGFEIIRGLDLDRAGMEDAVSKFARAASTADVAVFYYSGHAMQYAGVNYLVPIDARLTDEFDLRRLPRVDEIVADLQQAKNLRILVLDSCRDNPFADQLKRATRALSVPRGLARIDSPQGMIIAYATQAGRTADDGSGRNSPYTGAFLKHIEKQEEIGTVFRLISADVYQATNRKQLPELSLSFIGEFYLRGRSQIAVPPVPLPRADPCVAAAEHWKSAEAIGTMAAFEDHLARFPNCVFAGLAKARIDSLKNKMKAVAPSVQPAPAPADEVFWLAIKDSNTPARFEDFLQKFPASSRVAEARARLAKLKQNQLESQNNAPWCEKTYPPTLHDWCKQQVGRATHRRENRTSGATTPADKPVPTIHNQKNAEWCARTYSASLQAWCRTTFVRK